MSSIDEFLLIRLCVFYLPLKLLSTPLILSMIKVPNGFPLNISNIIKLLYFKYKYLFKEYNGQLI